ncbi:MAG: DUF3592 domain-containing protein [Lachnospiraceae bacterium]|nr:DUF3592 domain-containing protein [Lachnospiraceae bacterium]
MERYMFHFGMDLEKFEKDSVQTYNDNSIKEDLYEIGEEKMLALFMTFLLLFFIVLTSMTENMVFFGIALLIIGFLFFYIENKGMAVKPGAVFIMGVYSVVWGLLTIAESIMHLGYQGWIFAEGFGGVFLWFGIYQGIIKVIACKERVTAIYMGTKTYTTRKGGRYYNPMFSYIYQDRQYENSTDENFGKWKRKKYQKGNNYTIYLNPQNPNEIRTKRYPKGSEILLISLGIVLVSIPFWAK